MIVSALVLANGIACAAGCLVMLRAIADMKNPRERIRWMSILKATGFAIQILAALDYFIGDPYAWPWLLLFGVALANTGTALLYLLNRDCAGCIHRRFFSCVPR